MKRILSGGQTGADQGALSACLQCNFPYGGWIPRGRRTEKGKVPERYRALRQHRSRHYPPRTEANVMASDGTVVFTYGKPDGGSLLTMDFAHRHHKPCLHVDLNRPIEKGVARLLRWLKRSCPDGCILNVAGSRRSKAPGIHRAVKKVIIGVLAKGIPPSRQGDRRAARQPRKSPKRGRKKTSKRKN